MNGPTKPVITSYAPPPTRTITANSMATPTVNSVPGAAYQSASLSTSQQHWTTGIPDRGFHCCNRHVIAFDNKRVGASTGQVRTP